ncbi:MAG: glycosyltransferase family 4 protein [Ignavibacteria bacterium]|nr:glycosyltransferase family 4 protein [Ignavibacteria bacterium]
MKRILFISHSSSLTGAPLLLHDIAAWLDRSKYRLSFIMNEEGPLIERFKTLGPTILDPIYPDELKYWREVRRIGSRVRLLREIKPDLVYCNTIHPAKWLVYARLLGIPTLTHVHELSMGFAELSVFEHWIVKRFSQQFIAVSEAVENYLADVQKIQRERIHVVHAGINMQQFGRGNSTREIKCALGLENEFVIGTVGRIAAVKGSDLFIKLASLLKHAVGTEVKIKFLVVGTTEDREFNRIYNRMLDEDQIRNDIMFLENIKNVAEYYSIMDIYVSTAREDPFPLVILEAMASRKAVVTFAVGGIPEAVTSECGVLIDPLDITAMRDAILSLIHDPNKREMLGTAARARAEELFDLSRNIASIQQLIDSTIS